MFRRLNCAVALTEAGRCLVPGATEAFAALSAAWCSTKKLNGSGVLTVMAEPAFTAKWLAPRIYDFAQAHDEIELRFLATLRIIYFDRDEVDVAIRFGLGQDKELYARPLIEEWMTPEMAEKITSPEKLAEATLIHDDSINFSKCIRTGVRGARPQILILIRHMDRASRNLIM